MAVKDYTGRFFMYYESHPGSGEDGCYQTYEVTGPHYGEGATQLSPVRWIAHSCGKPRPNKSVSMWIEWMDQLGDVIWIDQ